MYNDFVDTLTSRPKSIVVLLKKKTKANDMEMENLK